MSLSRMRTMLVLAIFVEISSGFCPADVDGKPPEMFDEENDLFPSGGEIPVFEDGKQPDIVEGDSDFDGNEHLQQLADAVTSDKMDEIYELEGKKTSASLLLKYLIQETNIEPEYLTEIFLEKAEVSGVIDLEKKIFTEQTSLKFLSKILQHLQVNPPAKEMEVGKLAAEDSPGDIEVKQQDDGDQTKDEL